MKPIEAGCMAITYNCQIQVNNSKIVKVIRYVGNDDTFADRCAKHRWETDGSFLTSHGTYSNAAPEKYLMRLDDPDIQEEIESELMVVE